MSTSIKNLDVKEDVDETYLVSFHNKNKLLYDDLLNIFGVYGEIVSIVAHRNRKVEIRFTNKESAVSCYYELQNNAEFLVEMPNKCVREQENPWWKKELETKKNIITSKTKATNAAISEQSETHYARKKRNIIESKAFKRFVSSIYACNQDIDFEGGLEGFLIELKAQLKDVNLYFETGFEEELEDHSELNIINDLLSANEDYCYRDAKMVDAVDLLICSLPPWYEEVDVFQLVSKVIADDLLGVDWQRYHFGPNKCSLPYAVVYVKSRNSACKLFNSIDGLIVDKWKMAACLMEEAEGILLKVRNQLLSLK